MTGIAIGDKPAGGPLGAGEDDTHPFLVVTAGLLTVVLLPLVWGLLRLATGLPMFGSPALAQVEDPTYRPGGWRVARERPTSPNSGESPILSLDARPSGL